MRKFVTIGMSLTGLWTALSGFQMLTLATITSHAHHVAPAILFLIFMVLHVWLNWKAFLCRFKGLGWKWALVCVAVVIIFLVTFAHYL
jgi:hypothetical protein